jgi:hypothetical protein
MTARLISALQQLKDTKTRVAVSYEIAEPPVTLTANGYVYRVEDDMVYLSTYSGDTWASRRIRLDRVTYIRGTKGKRRKSGLTYPTYYQKTLYAETADGDLDLSSTLKNLFAFA